MNKITIDFTIDYNLLLESITDEPDDFKEINNLVDSLMKKSDEFRIFIEKFKFKGISNKRELHKLISEYFVREGFYLPYRPMIGDTFSFDLVLRNTEHPVFRKFFDELILQEYVSNDLMFTIRTINLRAFGIFILFEESV